MTQKGATNLFYIRLKSLSALSGKSLNQIERELGYPRNALSNYKSCHKPSAYRVMEVAKYFQVSPDYMSGYTDDAKTISVETFFKNLNRNQKMEMFQIALKWMIKEM